jgi:hypothetical protein
MSTLPQPEQSVFIFYRSASFMAKKIHTTVICLISLFAAIAVCGLISMRTIQSKNIRALITAEEKEFDATLSAHSSNIKTFVNDYTYWDDLVTFLSSGSKRWGQENIASPAMENGAQALWIYRPDFSMAYSYNTLVTDTLKSLPLPATAASSKIFSENSRFCHFFVNTPQGTMEVFGATIHPTFDAERKTIPKGYFFAGRLWSDDNIKSLAAITNSKINLVSAETADLPVKDTLLKGNTLSFARIFRDWEGKQLVYLYAEKNSIILGTAKRSLDRQFTVAAGIMLGFIALVSLFIVKEIVYPLRLISKSLNFEDPYLIRNLQNASSEFGYVARLITDFFTLKSELIKEGAEVKRSKDALKKAQSELEQRVKERTTEIASANEGAPGPESSRSRILSAH